LIHVEDHVAIGVPQHTKSEFGEFPVSAPILDEGGVMCVICPSVELDHDPALDKQVDSADGGDRHLGLDGEPGGANCHPRERLQEGLGTTVGMVREPLPTAFPSGAHVPQLPQIDEALVERVVDKDELVLPTEAPIGVVYRGEYVGDG